MRKMITAALMLATAAPLASIPVAAQAQSRGELRHDRRDIREERGELRQAYRHGNYRDVREERRDLNRARREYREDRHDRRWGRNDWRGYRDHNRAVFARGNWRAPFRYNSFRPGVRIQSYYYGPRYVVSDPWRYHLPRAYGYQRWIRHYNDLLLVDTRRGVVVDVIRGFYW